MTRKSMVIRDVLRICCVAMVVPLFGGCSKGPLKEVSELAAELSAEDVEDRYDAVKEIDVRAETMNDGTAALVVPALSEALRDDDPRIRYRAAKALSKLAAAAAPAVPQLTKTLGDDDPQTRYYTAKALSRVGRPARPALSELTRALADENDDVKYYAARALGNIGPDAKVATSQLQAIAQQSGNPKVQEAAREALEKLGAS